MKLLLEQSPYCTETEIKITCRQVDERLQRLIQQIKLYSNSVLAKKDGVRVPLALEEIYYFDTVDNRTYVYLEKEVYGCDRKLYELEEELAGTPFIRVSKSCILNTRMVERVRAQLSGRLEATLSNGEKVLVSKHYLRGFRDQFEG